MRAVGGRFARASGFGAYLPAGDAGMLTNAGGMASSSRRPAPLFQHRIVTLWLA